MPLYLLAAAAPSQWLDFLRLATSAFIFLIYPWRFLMVVCSAMLSASLVDKQLEYSATCSFRVLFAVVRLLPASKSSAATCDRLENAMHISMALFVVPVWSPLGGRFADVPTGRPAIR